MNIDYTWHNAPIWHNAPEELPLHEAVCVTYYNGGYHINVWNPYDDCWDDEEGDDFAMSADMELRWMALELDDEGGEQ